MKCWFSLTILLVAAATGYAATVQITGFGVQGWYSDDTRDAAGSDLVGVTNTHYGKPGQAPSAADDTTIAQQIQFVGGPPGSTWGGAVSIDGTSGNSGKSTISVINTTTGFAAASDLIDPGFYAQYEWYPLPDPTSRTVAFRLGIQSTDWANSQVGFTAIRSGESAWDLVLVHVDTSAVDNQWNTIYVDKDTSGVWALYAQAGNAYFSAPGGTVMQSLLDWANDPTWGPLLFGAGAKVTSVQLGLGSGQRQHIAYVDYLKTSILNGGDTIDFTASIVNLDTGESFSTIAAANNDADTLDGHTIKVATGTYPGAATITKSLTLRGANAGIHPAVGTHPTATVGTRGEESILSNNFPAISPKADNITIDGFMFTGDAGRIIDTYADANNFHLTNCVFENDSVATTSGVIQLGGGSHTGCLFDYNLFQDKGDHTLYFGGGPYDGLTIAYNKFNVEGDALFWAATPLVDGVINGNEFDGTIGGVPGMGFCTVNIGQGGNIQITNNWVHDVWYTAFQVGIIGGSVTDNTFERCYPYPGAGADAFQLWGGQWGTAVSTDVTIECNTIHYNDIAGASIPSHGVRLRAPEGGSGIDASTIHVNNNSFIDGGERSDAYAIRHQGDPLTTVDAENNWWGTTDTGVIAVLMDGNVDYDPILTEAPPCTQDNVLLLNVEPASLYVKPSETVVIDMDALNLLQPVTGVQAVMNFSSSFFLTGGSDVSVAPGGGGVWTELIYRVWNVDGDLDVAVGVDLVSPGSTQADNTTAVITLTSNGTEGETKVVFRPDGSDIASTFFSDVNHQPVYPNKIDSQMIVIDGTPPTVEVTSPNGGENLMGGGSWTITWTAADTYLDADSVQIEYFDGSDWQIIATGEDNDGSYDWNPVPSLDINNALVRVTVSDLAGNSADDSSDADFIIDSTDPVVDDIAATQGGPDLTPSGSGNATQGVVNIAVEVSDNLAGVAGAPTVTVTPNGGTAEPATLVDESPAGTFNYTWTVTSSTPNGTATITVSGLTDNAGNVADDATDTFDVNKTQITGTVSQSTLSTADYGYTRDVVFKATDGGGAVLATWTVPVSFTNNTGTKTASGPYTLTDVPSGTANLSAKTAWTLRERQGVSFDGEDQAVNDFTLVGGDLNGTNSVNILDYSILKENFPTTVQGPAADINGDLSVNSLDYTLLKSNWFTAGDPE